MSGAELDGEIAAGVAFSGYEVDGALAGVMGVQPVRDVVLIRHAYVVPARQREGIGAALLEHLVRTTDRRVLVGTWAAAKWAIGFYRRNGFALVGPERTAELLRAYWSIPERQIETSVVLELTLPEAPGSQKRRKTWIPAHRESFGNPSEPCCARGSGIYDIDPRCGTMS
jgi:N-acetylglutamate synthase-like GNAT family acetyltransferase